MKFTFPSNVSASAAEALSLAALAANPEADVYAHGSRNLESGVKRRSLWRGDSCVGALAQGTGRVVDEACDTAVRVARRVIPSKETSALMQRGYQTYRKIYPALHSIFAENRSTSAN